MSDELLEARQLAAVGGEVQEGCAASSWIAVSRAGVQQAEAMLEALFLQSKSAFLHHGAYDSVNEDAECIGPPS